MSYLDDDFADERDGEEPLDPTLAALARDYNAPPLTPRDAIWARIERERGTTATPAPAAAPLEFRRRARRWIPLAAGLAALLALAFALGRFSSTGVVDPAPAIAGRGGPAGGGAPFDSVSRAPSPDSAAPGDDILPEIGTDEPVLATESAPPAGRASPRDRAGTARTPRSTPPTAQLAANDRAEAPDAFDVAAARHLQRSEDFLSLFRDALRGEEPSVELSPATARQLLVRNRLLLDSPAAQDPRMRRLLEDLELVLAQIAQLPAEERSEDTDLITDGMEAGDVLTRLRSATSTGVAATLRQGAL
ncbi:MAG TPA: hypothetical protein VF037_11375 [Gemmatimonadales bacterium]